MEIDLSPYANWLLRKLGMRDQIQLLKSEIRNEAMKLFDKTVLYGPFHGMKIVEDSSWGKYDFLSKLFGEYEKHVLNEIIGLSGTFKHFINIGSADGYFAVGTLYSNYYQSGTAFEISQSGREITKKNANENNVCDRLDILGEANIDTIHAVIKSKGMSCILCDIEGAEFTLFDDLLLKTLQGCSIIIEVHDDGELSEIDEHDKLVDRAKNYFDVTQINRLSPAVNEFSELASWHDDKRLLAFSEGRAKRMKWLLLR